MMKRIVLVILFAALPVSLVFAQAGADKAPAKALAGKAAATGEIQQQLVKMENDWAAAASKKDVDTVSGMLANDWIGIGMGPDPTTKAQYLADYKSGVAKIDSITLSNMKVRVFGNTAVVTGADDEKSSYKGKDTSGHYVWTDVFVNRGGKWQAAASQFTQISGAK